MLSPVLSVLQVSGVVNNTGHSVVFTVDEEQEDPALNAAVGGLGGVPGSLVGGRGVVGPGGTLGRPLGENVGGGNGVDYLHQVHRHKNPPLNITGGPLSYRYRVRLNYYRCWY